MIVPIDIISHVEHHLYDSQLIGQIGPFLELILLYRVIEIQVLLNQSLFLIIGNFVKTSNPAGIKLNVHFSIQ